MPREYRNIKQYEKEILELKEKGLTKREIGEKFGLSKEQIKGFLKSKRRQACRSSLQAGSEGCADKAIRDGK